MDKNCSSCRYWNPVTPALTSRMGDIGDCHRSAPTNRQDSRAIWPRTASTESCGAHQTATVTMPVRIHPFRYSCGECNAPVYVIEPPALAGHESMRCSNPACRLSDVVVNVQHQYVVGTSA